MMDLLVVDIKRKKCILIKINLILIILYIIYNIIKMKKCIVYSITIYILLTMFILLHRPKILNDSNGDIKSWNYLKYKLKYGFTDMNELICLPTIIFVISIISFMIGIKLSKKCNKS